MRPIVVFLMVLAASSVTLLLWPKSDPLPGAYYVDANPTKTYGIYKYEDCITREVHATGHPQRALDMDTQPLTFQERARLDMQLGKYKSTLDSILHNLNTIDAHHYLHKEYDRYHSLLLQPQNSSVRFYYYAEILETCYAKDQALNLESVVYQKNKKR
ncbi:MAG: hypothetical protein AAFU57_10080 [Bacteroidota bacterium]